MTFFIKALLLACGLIVTRQSAWVTTNKRH